ncbi:glutamate synthase (plasmid) [Azospirillum humicireducens]|uniref:Glutamate synthase n=1 Tax=Azospirillum humicireducens TaxID=1226968 RepID=A0A2R4VTF2_9PROT|nr:NAD(P)-binding protein [Azospirillum humicireducens]AWB07723.1 glutamate synthase [Azospirillum humicireducens]
MSNHPFAITLDVGSSLDNLTGSWRTAKPVYGDRLPPCNKQCPAGENIQGWLYHAESGDYRKAWEVLMQDNPLPAIMGRACYHTCESACNRGQLDQPVSIHAVERFLGDLAIREGWQVKAGAPTGKRVLVIGAGPSGLSAAYHLARLGHAVTIAEAGPKVGGMMRFGIPSYRVPRDVLDAEVGRITAMGVEILLNTRIADIPQAMADGSYDACFAAIGAHLARRVDIPAVAAGRVLDAVSVLRGMECGDEPPQLGRRVVVYGGGNTAIDVARTAKRLGAEEATIVYRRTREMMPAHDFEVEEALEEGVVLNWLRTITAVEDGAMLVEKMALDEKGWPQPTGDYESIAGDTLILALGQEVDTTVIERVPGVEVNRDGTVKVGENLQTGYPGLFCGGDMVPSDRTVTVAVGHGKKAARHIDAYLRGMEVETPTKHPDAVFERLNSWYYTDAPQSVQPTLDLLRRSTSFDEVHGGLDEETAQFEARRCLSCGNCFECDNCFGVCPDNAIIKLGPGQRFQINDDFCKGCGICAAECPCGAIDMVPEEV